LELLKPAVELWPEEAAYQAALGWAYFKVLPPNRAMAMKHVEKALKIDPNFKPALQYKENIERR
jgi:hypothetical protein